MLLSQKVQFISKTLNQLFPSPKSPLVHKNIFTLLVAVVLSARATDAKVNELTPILFQKADTPQKLANLETSEIEKIIRPIGFYKTKAKNLKNLSRMLLENHQGTVPKTWEELEALPGVGHKTASVVMAQGFHIPAFPIDTHIYRCARRWGLSKALSVEKVEKDLKRLFPQKEWIRKHLQIIYFARKYCAAKKHKIENCPICSAL